MTDVTKMLDGQVAGVMSTSGGGQPGSGAELRIRGFGSINASNSPLLVVDGVPFDGDLNSINSSDIESMSVLKDASAGALYGARGANGVILITTKQNAGRGESLSVSLSAKVGVSSRAIPSYNTMSAREYMEHMYLACYNDLVYTEGYLPSVAAGMTADRLARQILGTDNIYNVRQGGRAAFFGRTEDREGRPSNAVSRIVRVSGLDQNGSVQNSRYLAC